MESVDRVEHPLLYIVYDHALIPSCDANLK